MANKPPRGGLAVYAFDIDGYNTLNPEEKRICRAAAEWAKHRVAEALRAAPPSQPSAPQKEAQK